MPPIRFRIRTIMITIAVSAAVMGGVRVATSLLGISGVWIDGDAMADFVSRASESPPPMIPAVVYK